MTPSQYLLNPPARSENGSSPSAHCSPFLTATSALGQATFCMAANTSILFDGAIPPLVGLEGNMWASQLQVNLLTFRATLNVAFESSSSSSSSPDGPGVDIMEVILFNCPEWGITVDSISISGNSNSLQLFGGTLVSRVRPNITSCDSFVRVCMPSDRTYPFLSINFEAEEATFLHIAEIRFNRDAVCSPDMILPNILPPPTPPPPTLPPVSGATFSVPVTDTTMPDPVTPVTAILSSMSISYKTSYLSAKN